MYFNQEELEQMIAAKLSPDQIMDILGWEMIDLVIALSENIQEYSEEFEKAVNEM